LRRETASAHAPEGTSAIRPVRDQIAKREEISAGERPLRAKRTAYSG
jgi:hypothetical protein